jgi:exonuclease III
MWKRLNEASFDTAHIIIGGSFDTTHIIIGGDFNHLEEVDQRGEARECFMLRRKAASWHHMTLQYGLVDVWKLDSFRKMSKKEYTFDNGRSGACSAVSRIDKFLVSQDFNTRGGPIEAATSVRKLLDHSPLVLTI